MAVYMENEENSLLGVSFNIQILLSDQFIYKHFAVVVDDDDERAHCFIEENKRWRYQMEVSFQGLS